MFKLAIPHSKIKIMEESVALISDIHEAGVEPRHDFPDFRQVDVAHRILLRTSFLLKFHETLVFQRAMEMSFFWTSTITSLVMRWFDNVRAAYGSFPLGSSSTKDGSGRK